jgi:nitroimidazol reductase NimA-like FMN-containing flavoprotein (pyridoxamine 5'-phosphate oxidase superfamily)
VSAWRQRGTNGNSGTCRSPGSPHWRPCGRTVRRTWRPSGRYEGGAFLILTERASRKARNIAADPRVELCIDDRERAPYHTVIVRGRAVLLPYPGDAWRLDLAVHYLGEERGRRYVESTAVSAEDEVLIRIEPEEFAGW